MGQEVGGGQGVQGEAEMASFSRGGFSIFFLGGSGHLAHFLPTKQPFGGCRWTGVNSNKTQS